MAFIRITIRTFQNEEHAQLFLAVSDQTIPALKEKGIKVNAKMAISQNKKHEVINSRLWLLKSKQRPADKVTAMGFI